MKAQAPARETSEGLNPVTRTLACLGVAFSQAARDQVAECQAERAKLLDDRDGLLG